MSYRTSVLGGSAISLQYDDERLEGLENYFCELCGARRDGEDVDPHDTGPRDTALAIKMIAMLYQDERGCCIILLLMIANPAITNPELAKITKRSNYWVSTHKRKLLKLYPELSGIAGVRSPKAIAQQRRRARDGFTARKSKPNRG